MPVMDSVKLTSLKDKLAKNVDEIARLKEQIAKEEQRLKDKEKRDTLKWWKELDKGMEQLLISCYGPDYKDKADREMILKAVSDMLATAQGDVPAMEECNIENENGEAGITEDETEAAEAGDNT